MRRMEIPFSALWKVIRSARWRATRVGLLWCDFQTMGLDISREKGPYPIDDVQPMTRRKKLTLEHLTALGPEALAQILLDEAARNKPLRRELNVLLAEQEGPSAVAKEVQKRIKALARSHSFVDWQGIRDLVRDLDLQRAIIVDKIAPADADLALDLMWRFQDLAGPTFERSDDGSGSIGDVFREAVEDMGPIAETASVQPVELADRVMACIQGNHYGTYDYLVASMFPALGEMGVSRLKAGLSAWRQELDAGSAPSEDEFGGSGRLRREHYAIDHCLQQLADVEGDVDAFVATHDDKALKNPVFASRIAWARLL